MLDSYYQELENLIADIPIQQVDISANYPKYSIDTEKRILFIDGKSFLIPLFFDFKNFCNNDIKTIDYIFTYFGYDYKNYIRV